MISTVSVNLPHSRRRFLTAAATLLASSQVFALDRRTREEPQAGSAQTLWIDCHLHCFAGNDDPRFPYHALAPYRPAAAATPEHLLACMDGAGVTRAIVVHPEPYQDDHRYLEHCLNVGAGRLKGTLLLFSDRPGSVSQMPALVKRLAVVATRVHAYAPDRLPPFGKPELREYWRQAAELGLAMQLHFEPRYAAGFEPLIREFSRTPVIIDHLGRPFQGTPEEHAIVLRWSDLPNTVIKLAAIPEPTSYPHRDIRPVIADLMRAYGADRMIYGGGFSATATPESYRAAFVQAASYLSGFSAADQAKVLGGNANRLFFS